jgi:hypothetical protein
LVVGVTLAVYLISSLPYLIGYAVTSSRQHFTGIVFDVVDTAQYFAWMRAFSNEIVIANPLTPEPGAERFFNLQWWLMGILAFKTPLGPEMAYQILRVVALAGFAFALAYFCRLVAQRYARTAFPLIMLASGFGWVLVLLKYAAGETELRYPLDVHIGEANTVFSAMAFPHLLVAGALLLTIFILFLRATGPRRWRYCAALVVITLALGLSHGYDLIPAMAIPAALATLLSLRERRISEYVWPAGAIVIGGVPPAMYALALTRLDGTWEGVLSQYGNASVYSPSPAHLVVLLGLPLLLALPQLRGRCWRGSDVPHLFVRTWAVLGFFLLYIPTDYQIKMLIAYQVPVGILAAMTIAELAAWLERHRPYLSRAGLRFAAAALVLGFVALTNVYLTGWRIVDLRRQDYPYYLAREDTQALRALEAAAGEGDVVLSSPELGVFVPVFTDARPYVAHWAQTLRYFERRDDAQWFFDPATARQERDVFVATHGIGFIISGPAEARLVAVTDPPPLAFDVISAGPTTLYRTSPESVAR